MIPLSLSMDTHSDIKSKYARISARARRAVNKAVHQVAEELGKDLKEGLLRNSSALGIRFREISDDWISQKNKEGWRSETILRTLQYVEAIKTTHEGDVHSITLPDTNYPGTHLTYGDLAGYLEHGTKNMRPIPHWSYAHREAKPRLRKALEEAIDAL